MRVVTGVSLDPKTMELRVQSVECLEPAESACRQCAVLKATIKANTSAINACLHMLKRTIRLLRKYEPLA